LQGTTDDLGNEGYESNSTSNRQQAAGNRQQAAGNRQQAAGNRQQATGILITPKKQLESTS
jgi:hypothetical protein